MNHSDIVTFIKFCITKINILIWGGTQLNNSYLPNTSLVAKVAYRSKYNTN